MHHWTKEERIELEKYYQSLKNDAAKNMRLLKSLGIEIKQAEVTAPTSPCGITDSASAEAEGIS